MTPSKKWWRVEFDHEGKLVSCILAEKPEHDGGLIYYVRSVDFEGAERRAFNAYMLRVTTARHVQYAREGKCRCGRPRDAEGKLCSGCLKRNTAYLERSRAKARGEDIPKRPRIEVLEENRALDRAAHRIEVLREAYRQFLAAQCRPAAFGAWITSQIEASERQVA